MKARVAETGGVMNEARMRMTRVPAGAELVLNKVSAAPGFWIGNVIVMAGVPHIMQVMLDYVAPKLKTGAKMLSESVRADCREGDIGTELGEIAKKHPDVIIGSYPFMDEKRGGNTNVVVRSRDPQKLAAAKSAVEAMLTRVRAELGGRPALEDAPWPSRNRKRRRFIRKKSFRCRGTNSIATPARWLGGSTARARSRRSSASPAAAWCRRRSWRASSASG